MKGWSAFSKKTDPKLKIIAKPLAKGAQEMGAEMAGQAYKNVSKRSKMRHLKDIIPKSRYTGRTPQSQMTDEELAAKKGIKAPQSAYKKKEKIEREPKQKQAHRNVDELLTNRGL